MGTVITILSLIPSIIRIVREIEDAIPMSGKGKEKLDLVLGAVEDISKEADLKDKDKNALIRVIPAVVGRIVALFNALGIFKTSNEVPVV